MIIMPLGGEAANGSLSLFSYKERGLYVAQPSLSSHMIIIFIQTYCFYCEVYRVLNAFEAYRDRFAILWFKSQVKLTEFA